MTQWRDWSTNLTARIAAAVKVRRAVLQLSAAEVADRTAVGKPLTRAVISDLETGRKKTLEVTELLTLAAALEVSPVLLLFPDYPDEDVEVLPGVVTPTEDAADWVAGRGVFPPLLAELPAPNTGLDLVRAVDEYAAARDKWAMIDTKRDLNKHGKSPELDASIAKAEREMEVAWRRVLDAKARLWSSNA